MVMTYELWNTTSRNRYGEYDTRQEALAAVRSTVRANGRALAEVLALNSEDEEGEIEVIARGAGLVELAEREAQASPAVTGMIVRGVRVVVVNGRSVQLGQKTSARSGVWVQHKMAAKLRRKDSERHAQGRVHNTDRSTGKTYKEPSGKKDGR